jgi:hypothetical protein
MGIAGGADCGAEGVGPRGHLIRTEGGFNFPWGRFNFPWGKLNFPWGGLSFPWGIFDLGQVRFDLSDSYKEAV